MSLAQILAAAWAAWVLAAAWLVRPHRSRLGSLVSDARADGGLPTPPGAGSRAPGVAAVAALADWVGGLILGASGRSPSASARRRLGSAVVAGALAVPLSLGVAPAVGLAVWALPALSERRQERRRLEALAADVPDVVDLLALAVGAGLTVRLALQRVAVRAPGPLGRELARVCAEAGSGRRLADALEDLPARAGEAVRPLVSALVGAERYGAPIGATLDRLASDVRRDRRRHAEEAARKVPVKLLFPLVTCTLPAFALLTVAPLVANGVRSLSF